MDLTILYRGPLSSCNYGCPYCPFAKRKEGDEEHARDAAALERFLQWVEGQPEQRLSVFFTPWGEALIRRRYQKALARLTNLPHVRRVAIQTNLSSRLDWIDDCQPQRLGIWATYHPGETRRGRFLAQIQRLIDRKVNFSVGVVGLKEHAAEIEALRRELPAETYLWVNAYKRVPDYYDAEEIQRLTAIDPLFPLNNQRHASRGESCRAGASVISVDGDGVMRRCHFLRETIGNLYQPNWQHALMERVCTAEQCGCHIGYIYLDRLGLSELFGDGILERVPIPEKAEAFRMVSSDQVSARGR